MPSAMLSAVLEEEADMYEAFPPHVDPTGITILTDSPPGKKAPLKSFEELQPLLQQSRKRELKLVIRENSWPINSPVRASLWPALCRQHQHGKSMLDGFYWDMVTQFSLLFQYRRKGKVLIPGLPNSRVYQNSTGTTGDYNFRRGLTSKSLTDLGCTACKSLKQNNCLLIFGRSQGDSATPNYKGTFN